MVASSLPWLWRFKRSALSALRLSSLSWWVVRVQGNADGSPLSYPKGSAHHFNRLGLCLEFFLSREFSCSTSWTLALWTPAYTGDTTPHCWWWRDPGDCRLEPYRGLIAPDEPAYTILSVAVCSFIGCSWCKAWCIPTLTLLFSVHEVQYAAQHSGSCS